MVSEMFFSVLDSLQLVRNIIQDLGIVARGKAEGASRKRKRDEGGEKRG